MSAEYLLIPKKDYRPHVPLTEEQLVRAAEDRKIREVRVREDLPGLTEGLDPIERILYSAAFRYFNRVEDSSDHDLFESIEKDVIGDIRMLQSSMLLDGNKNLTPQVLWESIPALDPHHRHHEANKFSVEPQTVLYDSTAPIVMEPLPIAA